MADERRRRHKRPAPTDHTPPHVMWPEPGAGFQPNPGSPAGRLALGQQLVDAARYGSGPARRAALVVMAVSFVLLLVAVLVALRNLW